MKTFLLLLITVFLFTTCKKYPEGGYLKQSQKHILGNWKLDLYEVNGIDSTNLIDFNGSDDYKSITISELKTTNTTHTLRIDGKVGIGFRFVDKYMSLFFSSSYSSKYCPTIQGSIGCYRIIYSPEAGDVTWYISKLTKNELMLKTNLKNSYTIKLIK